MKKYLGTISVSISLFCWIGCASKDVVSTPYPKPSAKSYNVKIGTLYADKFSIAHEEGNYDKRYLDHGRDIKYYWVAEPKWEPGAPEKTIANSLKDYDIEFAVRNPWIQSRVTKNFPIVAVQKRVRTQQFFMMNLSTWDVCYASKLNIKQTAYSNERYDVSDDLDRRLAEGAAFSINSTNPVLVTCDKWDKLPNIAPAQ